MGLLDFITKPIDPERGGNQEYDIFLAERGVKEQSWNYDYTAAYEDYKETGVDPYDKKSKHWVSKFKHPLSDERYLKDEETNKYFDTIENKFVNEEVVAQQKILRLDYLDNMPLNGNKKR